MTALPFADERQAREAICRVGRSLFERGYVHATAGNISVRLAEGWLITPTDACLGRLDPDRLSRVDADGRQVSGDRASKTLELHRRIYAATEAAGQPACCVLHTHSTHLVAASLIQSGLANGPADETAELLPALTPYFVMKVGRVPHLPYQRPGAPEAAQAVERAIGRHASAGRPIRALMLARLGPVVWHEHPEAAMATLEELEETARLWMLTRGADASHPAPLDDTALETLRRSFGASW